MNAKPEQIQIKSSSNVDAAEKNNLIAPDAVQASSPR